MNSQIIVNFKNDDTRLDFLKDIERLIYKEDSQRDIGECRYYEGNVVFDVPSVALDIPSATDSTSQSLSLEQALIAADISGESKAISKKTSQDKKKIKKSRQDKKDQFLRDAHFLNQQVSKLEKSLMLSESQVLGLDCGFECFQVGEDEYETVRRASFYGLNDKGENAVNTYYLYLDGAILFMLEDITEEDGKFWGHPAS
jgi:uncharacterized protein YhbP (UPF0306 family)